MMMMTTHKAIQTSKTGMFWSGQSQQVSERIIQLACSQRVIVCSESMRVGLQID